VTTPPSKGLVVELYLIYFGLAQSFVDDSSIEWLDANETVRLDPPDFTQGLNMLEVQNNLKWLPTVTNIPALSALRANVRTPAAAPLPRASAPAPAIGGLPPLAAEAAEPPRRDPGRQVRNPSR
jgi:hypothetical protein